MIHIPAEYVPSDAELEGADILNEGRSLFVIRSARYDADDKALWLNCKCLAGAGPVGGVMEQRFSTTPKSYKFLLNFMKRMGLLERGRDHFGVDLDPQALVGLKVIADVKTDVFETNKGGTIKASRWELMSYYAHDDPRAGDLAMIGRTRPVATPAANGHAPAPSTNAGPIDTSDV